VLLGRDVEIIVQQAPVRQDRRRCSSPETPSEICMHIRIARESSFRHRPGNLFIDGHLDVASHQAAVVK